MSTAPKKPAKEKSTAAAGKAPAKKKKPRAIKYCAEDGCKLTAAQEGYCRLHYIKNFRDLKNAHQKRAERRLNAYVDRLAKKYPNDYLERIKEGIENEEKFKRTMEELELDEEGNENETEREYLERLTNKLKLDE